LDTLSERALETKNILDEFDVTNGNIKKISVGSINKRTYSHLEGITNADGTTSSCSKSRSNDALQNALAEGDDISTTLTAGINLGTQASDKLVSLQSRNDEGENGKNSEMTCLADPSSSGDNLNDVTSPTTTGNEPEAHEPAVSTRVIGVSREKMQSIIRDLAQTQDSVPAPNKRRKELQNVKDKGI
jgi:hypothetical protein